MTVMEVEVVRVALQTLSAVTAAWLIASPAAGQDEIPRTIVGIDDGRGGLAMAVELSLKIYQPLTSPRLHGDYLVDHSTPPGSAEEAILQYVDMVISGDTTGLAALHEPDQVGGHDGQPCGCGSNREPYYGIPDTFKSVSFQHAWRYRDYYVIRIEFKESIRRSSAVFIATRLHDGKPRIATRPRDPVFEVVEFLLALAGPHRTPARLIGSPPDTLDHAVQIDGGTNAVTVHFGGILHSSDFGWQPAGRSRPSGRVAAFAADLLATSADLSDDEFIDLLHPWVSQSARARAGRDPDYMGEVRGMYTSASDIAHVFTVEVSPRFLHTYLTQDQPDRLRSMLIMEDDQDLAPAGLPPHFALESLMALDPMQQYLLELWHGQD